MSGLTTLNEFSNVANMIHSRQISKETKNRFKYMYLEGLIKFLKMYAINEIGSQCELDLYRIAMYVNSVKFENEDVYWIKKMDDIYDILTEEVIMGYPIWRFLKLSPSQLSYLESTYSNNLNKLKEVLEKEKSCRMCYFYYLMNTPYGSIEKCYCDKGEDWVSARDRIFDSSEVKDCKFFSKTKPKFEDEWQEHRCSGSVKEIKVEDLDFYRITNKDIKELEADLERTKSIDKLDKSLVSIGMIMSGKRGLDDRDRDSLKAIQFSTLYQFMDVHLQIEYGNAFEPNVAKIAKDIYENKFYLYKTEEDFLKYIENSIIKDPRWATKYSKKIEI